MNIIFIPKTVLRVERYIIVRVYVKSSTTNEFEVDYYGKLLKVIELQYHSEQDTLVLFKYYWYGINREIRVNLHHGIVKVNKIGQLHNVNDVFVFAK
jgi:hypothetical protein